MSDFEIIEQYIKLFLYGMVNGDFFFGESA